MKRDNIKKTGQVFTPQYIVDEILDFARYSGPSIIGKHIIDNSCGNGSFLRSIVKRYCEESFKIGINKDSIKKDLEQYIHGIDIDKDALCECIKSLNTCTLGFKIHNVKWDLYNQDSFSIKKFDKKMDYVVGNPPYVRIHNLDTYVSEIKKMEFTNKGMTDLYLAFFKLGFDMLNSTGKICYITPISWLNSVAAKNMRISVFKNKNLSSLIDFEHFNPFKNTTTYTIISLFDNDKKCDSFDYYTYDYTNRRIKFYEKININDSFIDSCFYLSEKTGLDMLRKIKEGKLNEFVSVKNGFATLADNVFIGEEIPDSNITIKAFKASTGKWKKCLFPYDKNGKLLPPNIALSDKIIYEYFNKHKNILLKGKEDCYDFYKYGRSQAVKDVWIKKIAINNLIRNSDDLKIEKVNEGCGIYSGLYVIIKNNTDFETVKNILIDNDFFKYVKLLKKYKSGGYYTFSSKDVQSYINYQIGKRRERII